MPFAPIDVEAEIKKRCEKSPEFKRLWEEREKINFNDIDASIYNALAKILDKNKFLSFFHNHNLKFFRQLINKHNLVSENENVFEVICKIYYNLGGFNLPEKFEEKTKKGLCIRKIDYAQKVGEFIKENFDDVKTSYYNGKLVVNVP